LVLFKDFWEQQSYPKTFSAQHVESFFVATVIHTNKRHELRTCNTTIPMVRLSSLFLLMRIDFITFRLMVSMMGSEIGLVFMFLSPLFAIPSPCYSRAWERHCNVYDLGYLDPVHTNQ
jgi:hypothetical protein